MTDPIALVPKLDLAAASDLKATLQTQTQEEVVLDFSQVTHFGALCVQVLLAAANTAISEGRKLSLVNVSDRVVDQLRVMGLTPEMITRGSQ